MDLKLVKTKDINEMKQDLQKIKESNKEIQEVWMDSSEAAKFLKVCTRTLKRYRDMGKIPFAKDGRIVRFRKSDLINYLNKHYFTMPSA